MPPTAELVYFSPATADRGVYAKRIHTLFDEYHRAHGLRHTPQRKAILDHLLAAERHLGQEEIYRALKSRGIGRVTVFRTLKLLVEAGLADYVTPPEGAPRYEILRERPHHDHLICVECGQVTEIRWPEVEKIQERDCRRLGFTPLWHRHELFGRCSQCADKRTVAR